MPSKKHQKEEQHLQQHALCGSHATIHLSIRKVCYESESTSRSVRNAELMPEHEHSPALGFGVIVVAIGLCMQQEKVWEGPSKCLRRIHTFQRSANRIQVRLTCRYRTISATTFG